MELTILGFNSATPKKNFAPTAQLLKIANRHFLIDCGEGTQVQLRRGKEKFSRINHIFISHLHGDHVFGLIGLISTLNLMGRETPMTIFGPVGIKELIEVQLRLTNSIGKFEINFIELSEKESELIFEDDKVEVFTIPLDHRVYANGFLFREKPKLRKLNIDEIKKHPEIETCDYENLRRGRDFELSDGSVISNLKLTYEPDKSLSYAFCSDTRYNPDIVPIIKNVDLLYHESTFLSDLSELADFTGHSTAAEAATIAKKAEVGQLILGHFSNRYKDLNVMLDESKPIFENTILPQQLGVYKIEIEKHKV